MENSAMARLQDILRGQLTPEIYSSAPGYPRALSHHLVFHYTQTPIRRMMKNWNDGHKQQCVQTCRYRKNTMKTLTLRSLRSILPAVALCALGATFTIDSMITRQGCFATWEKKEHMFCLRHKIFMMMMIAFMKLIRRSSLSELPFSKMGSICLTFAWYMELEYRVHISIFPATRQFSFPLSVYTICMI